MFTNNYISYKAMMFCATNAYTPAPHPSKLPFVWTNGATIGSNNTPMITASHSYHGDLGYWLVYPKCRAFPQEPKSSNTDPAFGVYFGSGSTPASKTDHRLEYPIESGLSIAINKSTYVIRQGENGKYALVMTYLITNNSESEVNIYEIGVVTPIAKDTYSHYPTLMERTVLTEPITIPVGATRAVEYRVIFNQI